jgi:mannose-1-phosphate guanylyltransferase/mannose-6-phosphate isomerase
MACRLDESQNMKNLVDELNAKSKKEAKFHLTIDRPWGSYTVLPGGESHKVNRLNMSPGAHFSEQTHSLRSEHWVVISGTALAIKDGKEVRLETGDSLDIPRGARHSLKNTGKKPLEIIEIQTGSYFGEDDILRFD